MSTDPDALSPTAQFKIKALTSEKFEIGGLDLSFTNSALWMAIAVIVSVSIMLIAVRKRTSVPNRGQYVVESLYLLVSNIVRENVGKEGMKYFPFIFTLFTFVLFGNLLGLIPGSFTYTSHIIVTFAMALFVFLSVTLIGIFKHGIKFLGVFFPPGAPLWTAPLLIPVEVISYFSRPISLAVRLFANITVGHVMLKVIAGFVVALGVAGIVPLATLVAITALELLVAIIQAYVITILTCVYLNEALHLH